MGESDLKAPVTSLGHFPISRDNYNLLHYLNTMHKKPQLLSLSLSLRSCTAHVSTTKLDPTSRTSDVKFCVNSLVRLSLNQKSTVLDIM